MSRNPKPADRPSRTASLVLAGLLALLVGCQNIENYLPDVVEITGTVVQVAAGIFLPEYATAVDLLMETLTPAAVNMAATWGEHRRQEKELERLAEIDAEISDSYSDSAAISETDTAGAWSTPDEAGASWSTVQQADTPEDDAATEPPLPWPAPTDDAADPWGDLYTSKSVPAEDEPLVVRLDVALLRDLSGTMTEIADGEVLRDGAGPRGGDRLRVFFRPEQRAFVYVVAVDAMARVQPVFPAAFPDRHNPVPAGRGVLLPGPGAWYGLDEHKGVQQVFFYASFERRPDLEAQLAKFAGGPPAPTRPGSVTEATILEASDVQARGLTGIRPLETITSPSGSVEIQTQRASSAAGQDLALTRWFRHE